MRALLTLLLLSSSLFATDFLYVIHAKSGTYDSSTNRLVLHEIDHSVTYFSDDRQRRAGKTTVTAFLFNLLGKDKEFNAGFIYYTDNERQYNDIPLELSEPHYNFQDDSLSFHIEVLAKGVHIHREMEEVNLFIDDVPELER